jgi:hypothetical protein
MVVTTAVMKANVRRNGKRLLLILSPTSLSAVAGALFVRASVSPCPKGAKSNARLRLSGRGIFHRGSFFGWSASAFDKDFVSEEFG